MTNHRWLIFTGQSHHSMQGFAGCRISSIHSRLLRGFVNRVFSKHLPLLFGVLGVEQVAWSGLMNTQGGESDRPISFSYPSFSEGYSSTCLYFRLRYSELQAHPSGSHCLLQFVSRFAGTSVYRSPYTLGSWRCCTNNFGFPLEPEACAWFGGRPTPRNYEVELLRIN